MMDYNPQPIDTAAVPLSDELSALTERLAENAHDHWARQRMDEGWTWGPKRDDASKQHPDLVPYAQLPDSEREYDRRTAMETLKAIIALGYRIERS
jgi:ryanodine receptor 2